MKHPHLTPLETGLLTLLANSPYKSGPALFFANNGLGRGRILELIGRTELDARHFDRSFPAQTLARTNHFRTKDKESVDAALQSLCDKGLLFEAVTSKTENLSYYITPAGAQAIGDNTLAARLTEARLTRWFPYAEDPASLAAFQGESDKNTARLQAGLLTLMAKRFSGGEKPYVRPCPVRDLVKAALGVNIMASSLTTIQDVPGYVPNWFQGSSEENVTNQLSALCSAGLAVLDTSPQNTPTYTITQKGAEAIGNQELAAALGNGPLPKREYKTVNYKPKTYAIAMTDAHSIIGQVLGPKSPKAQEILAQFEARKFQR